MSLSGSHGFDRWGEGGEWDALDGGFIFFDGGCAAEAGGEDDAALEEAGGGGHDGVSFFGFFLVPHAEVTAGVFEVHHVFVCGVHLHFWISVAERLRGFAFRMDLDRSASRSSTFSFYSVGSRASFL